ncbi:ligase-associated DNA damage response endonuclease PdeM [Litorimonas sp. RW-G-Af-16]|uniref:ligase-associated DNA damage response endonuclease PdeM n=1 Tax=Litorimonas sp. RW-G-Af-16 TaxID=3241168 RepID=UPI00390CD689
MRSVTIETRAGPVVCDAAKVAYLPDHDTLLMGDLHFEKASFLQMNGHAPLPALDTQDTLERLWDVIGRYAPAHVVALGDSFHDVDAGDRLSAKHVEAMNALVTSVPKFTWVLGNHDPDIPKAVTGEQQDHLTLGRFLLTHLPTDSDAGEFNMCGHLHPKARVKVRKRAISHPCFACGENRIILPSFGTFTGGLYVSDIAIARELHEPVQYVLTDNCAVYPITAR